MHKWARDCFCTGPVSARSPQGNSCRQGHNSAAGQSGEASRLCRRRRLITGQASLGSYLGSAQTCPSVPAHGAVTGAVSALLQPRVKRTELYAPRDMLVKASWGE